MADRTFPKHKVLPWPAVPIPTPDEVYAGLTDQAKEYPLSLEKQLRQSENFKKPENLTTVRVLDLSKGMIIGNWCSSMLSELGSDTIKCEPPDGDPLRWQTPFGRKEYMIKDAETGEPIGLHFLHEMRNKQSITLNLEKPEGRELLKKLAVHVDVLIENYPPGQFDAWGIGYRQLKEINPRLVYCWVGQKGQWGPSKDKPGNLDPTAQASCGFVHGTGLPKEFGGRPTRSAMWMADQVGGTSAAIGILAALLYRDKVSGKGQFIEATAAEAVIRILDYNWGWYGFDGSIRPRYGNWDLAINIYAVNPCKDGYFMVGGGHDRLWYRIWRTVGQTRPDLEDEILDDKSLRVVTARLPHLKQVKTYTVLADWQKDHSRADAMHQLLAQQVASGGVNYIDEVAEDPHFKYRGHVDEIDDRLYGKVLYGTSPLLEDKAPARLKWIGRPLGYDNEEIYLKLLGLGPAEVAGLKKRGVV
jgi:crotonobetainyl-CoA:carnitine CoA-transferase CaiB-like acyl-CoA transferase